MASVFQKAMIWLGLAPDDEYDDYRYDDLQRPMGGPVAGPRGYGPEPDPGTGTIGPVGPAPRPGPRVPAEPDDSVRPVARPSGVRPTPSRPTPRAAVSRDGAPTVRPMRPTSAKPITVSPDSFDDAKEIADGFKAERPVVMDLTGVDRDLARRLIDFASGMCYALSGSMSRVSPGRYLLTPIGVEISDEERRRLGGG